MAQNKAIKQARKALYDLSRIDVLLYALRVNRGKDSKSHLVPNDIGNV